ncbi:MAG: iron-containing alcohol dehydrogenase, partial [Anaeroplasmataceae bacterium]
LRDYMFIKNDSSYKLNSKIVGMSAYDIASNAGFSIPKDTSIILVECKDMSYDEPFSIEKLSPVLAIYKSSDSVEGLELARKCVHLDGLGHSAVIHTKDKELVKKFTEYIDVIRVIWNSPSTFGGIGNVYNSFIPSLTLGCASYGKNSTGDNVNVVNLLNIKQIGKRRNNMQWFKVPSKIYFEENSIEYLSQMKDINKVFIVTDRQMVDLGFVHKITEQLRLNSRQITFHLFTDVESDPSIQTIKKGVELMQSFKPDTIIALGGGSPMDAAKGMWLFYENPEVDFKDLKQKFIDIRKRAFKYPELGKQAKLVCIPTTSGTGSEVTPFTVITDQSDNSKYPLADYSLTPTIAIIDPQFTYSLPAKIVADTGMDVLTHAVEAYVSILANDYTDALCIKAIDMVFKYLKRSYTDKNDLEAKEKMHNASCLAGMAFANAFLGVNHAIAHNIGALYHVPHGRANSILLPHVIRYNAIKPSKISTWPKYNFFKADEKYADLARLIGLEFKTNLEGANKFADAVSELAISIGLSKSFKEEKIDEADYNSNIEKIAYLAYEDQCSPANPKVPMVEDIKEILRKAYKTE